MAFIGRLVLAWPSLAGCYRQAFIGRLVLAWPSLAGWYWNGLHWQVGIGMTFISKQRNSHRKGGGGRGSPEIWYGLGCPLCMCVCTCTHKSLNGLLS